MVLDKIYFCCKMEKRNYIEWEKIILRLPKPTRILPRGANPPRIRVFNTCRLMGALSDPSLYSIVLLADRWSGPARALSPYRKQSPNSQCSFLASFWPKGGARWNALPARRRGRKGRSIRRLIDGARQNIIPSSISHRSRSLSVPLARSRLRRTRMRQKWWG